MKKLIKISAVIGLMISLSSCGIFKKDCGCPHFGAAKHAVKANQA